MMIEKAEALYTKQESLGAWCSQAERKNTLQRVKPVVPLDYL
jgi:hypothetical protein